MEWQCFLFTIEVSIRPMSFKILLKFGFSFLKHQIYKWIVCCYYELMYDTQTIVQQKQKTHSSYRFRQQKCELNSRNWFTNIYSIQCTVFTCLSNQSMNEFNLILAKMNFQSILWTLFLSHFEFNILNWKHRERE